MNYRLKVLSPIIYRGKALPSGRLIRCDRQSISYFMFNYGSAVALWSDWPNAATEPFADDMPVVMSDTTHLSTLDLESEAWEEE